MKQFNEWNEKKKTLDRESRKNYIRTRDVWFTYIGVNIGKEQCGDRNFLRPVIIMQIFANGTFWGVPITTKEKLEHFSIPFDLRERKQWALVDQFRLFDTKRVKNKIGKINYDIYRKIVQKQEALLLPGSRRTLSNTQILSGSSD